MTDKDKLKVVGPGLLPEKEHPERLETAKDLLEEALREQSQPNPIAARRESEIIHNNSQPAPENITIECHSCGAEIVTAGQPAPDRSETSELIHSLELAAKNNHQRATFEQAIRIIRQYASLSAPDRSELVEYLVNCSDTMRLGTDQECGVYRPRLLEAIAALSAPVEGEAGEVIDYFHGLMCDYSEQSSEFGFLKKGVNLIRRQEQAYNATRREIDQLVKFREVEQERAEKAEAENERLIAKCRGYDKVLRQAMEGTWWDGTELWNIARLESWIATECKRIAGEK